MTALRLSVVVVSWGRPRALSRCLTALAQMRSIRFEVIVVADGDGMAVARAHPAGGRLVVLPQRAENISAARNDGLAAAAGDVVGFIDDDAVPEPGWAEAVLAAFEDRAAAAVTGPVIGRNGLSLQWGRMSVDRVGRDRWLTDQEGPAEGETLKLHGTNMAVRRAALVQAGGFDTGFRFYLDETDLARRLADAGHQGRYLPSARVHHGFAASRRRSEARVPLDLHDIGASTALFLRKHAPQRLEAGLAALEQEQRARLLRLARRRKLGAEALRHLMESLSAGIGEGRDRAAQPGDVPAPSRGFAPLRTALPGPVVELDGWLHRAGRLRERAAALAADGQTVALLLLEPSPRKHRVAFTEGGWWEQRGGLWGPADRSGPRIQFWREKRRRAVERDRLRRLVAAG